VSPLLDVNAKNGRRALGAKLAMAMDFSDYDRTPMFELNEMIWKRVRGARNDLALLISRSHSCSE
jgi:hypothetical protein